MWKCSHSQLTTDGASYGKENPSSRFIIVCGCSCGRRLASSALIIYAVIHDAGFAVIRFWLTSCSDRDVCRFSFNRKCRISNYRNCRWTVIRTAWSIGRGLRGDKPCRRNKGHFWFKKKNFSIAVVHWAIVMTSDKFFDQTLLMYTVKPVNNDNCPYR